MRLLGSSICAVIVVSAAIASCSSSSPSGAGGASGNSCQPGAQNPCSCSDVNFGYQTCAADGRSYGICICSQTNVDASAGGGNPGTDGGADGGDAEAGVPLGTPLTLVQGLSGIQDLVVYTSNVYWTSADGSGIVAQCSVGGCSTAQVLGSNQAFPRGIAVTNGVVMWTVYETKIPDGGFDVGFLGRATAGATNSGKTYLTGQTNPDAIAADPNNVYWSASGQVQQCELFGCTIPITLAAETAQAIALDASYVYWTNSSGQVSRATVGGGGTPTQISTASEPSSRGLVLAGGNVFWATATTVLTCPITGCMGAPTTLATGQNIVALRHPLGGDATYVYWSNDKTVVRCPLAGCPVAGPELVADGQSEPTSVAVDATYIYWVDGDSIKRLPKPL